ISPMGAESMVEPRIEHGPGCLLRCFWVWAVAALTAQYCSIQCNSGFVSRVRSSIEVRLRRAMTHEPIQKAKKQAVHLAIRVGAQGLGLLHEAVVGKGG